MPVQSVPTSYFRVDQDPFFPKVEELDSSPVVLALLPDFAFISLIKKAILQVCKKVNENTRRTLQDHLEGHRDNERRLQKKCQETYMRTIQKKII